MTKQNRLTRISASLLLIPLLHAVLFAVFGGLSSLLEIPCDRGGIYCVTSSISFFLLTFFPMTVIASAGFSVSLGICALRRKESIAKNVTVIALWAILTVLVLCLTVRFWQGVMSV